MSGVSGGTGWWLASDGRWYPPELAPSPVDAPPGLPPSAHPSPVAQVPVPGHPAPTGQPPPTWGAGPPTGPGRAPLDPFAPTLYPYPAAPAPVDATTSPMAVWALVLVLVLGAVGALVGIPLAFVARSRIRASRGSLKGSGLALAALIIGFVWVGLLVLAIAIPTFLGVTGSGPSVQTLDANVLGQVTGSAPNDFGITGVRGVTCEPPITWTTGTRFICVVYGPIGNQVGRYVGTVDPNAPDGTYQWNGQYVPGA